MADHQYRNCQKECELRSHIAARAKQNATENRRARTGSTRNHRQHLETADQCRCLERNLRHALNRKMTVYVSIFQYDKQNAVENQHRCYDSRSSAYP